MCALAIALLCGAAPQAWAEVVEKLEWTHYSAHHRKGESLLQTLNRASPIRDQGGIFHGYTRWSLNWSFRWWRESDGRCRVTEVTTTVSGAINLPELSTKDPDIRRRFDDYYARLRSHELGHFEFGLRAARKVDREILALPEAESCSELDSRVNALGRRALDQAVADEIEYDRHTDHGRTQGAWLER